MCDVAEAMLIKRTTEGDMNAIRFVLKNLDPRYMDKRSVYIEPQKIIHKHLKIGETCDQCGSSPMPEETRKSIMRAFKNFGIIKDDEGEEKK